MVALMSTAKLEWFLNLCYVIITLLRVKVLSSMLRKLSSQIKFTRKYVVYLYIDLFLGDKNQ